MAIRMLKSLFALAFLCASLMTTTTQAQDSESGYHFHLSAPDPFTMEFTFRAREPSAPPVADNFFGDGVAGSGQAGGCRGNGINNALRCGVTDKIKNNFATTPGTSINSQTQQAETAEQKEPTQSKLVLTLTPKVEQIADGSFKVSIDAKPEVTYSGAKPSDNQKKQLEAEALTGLPGDIKAWSATFTQKDLQNLHDAKATIHYDLHDQLKSMQMYNPGSRLRLKLHNQKVLDPQIKAVILVDDQFGQRLKPGQKPDRDYRYPYYENGKATGGVSDRFLLILGQYLSPPGGIELTSLDEKISYSVLSNGNEELHALAQALSGLPRQEGEEILYAKADLAPGVLPGKAELSLNGQTGAWGLGFVDRTGLLAFVRPDSHPGALPESTFYYDEVIRVGIVADKPGTPLDGISASLKAIKIDKTANPPTFTTRDIESLPLKVDVRDNAGQVEDRLNDNGRNIALSEPFKIIRKSDDFMGPQPPGADTTNRVVLFEGEKLAATIPNALSFFSRPRMALANIEDHPPEKGPWEAALEQVGKCKGIRGRWSDYDFARQPARTISHTFFAEGFSKRNIQLQNGDLAALALIRNEMIPYIQRTNKRLLAFRGTGEDGRKKARAYADLARNAANLKTNPFWRYRKVRISGLNAMGNKNFLDVPLYETVDLEALTAKVNKQFNGRFSAAVTKGREIKLEKVREQVEDQLQKHLTEQYDQTQAAIGRATDAGYCGVEELLLIAGQRADIAVSNLLPKLMKKENGKWVPDVEARRYVRSVHIKGQAVKAQKEYDSVDTSVLSATVGAAAALFTAGASYYAAGAAAGGATSTVTTAALFSMGVDLADAFYFGQKGLTSYLEGESNYATTVGLSPVLSATAIGEAEAGRQSGMMTALGLILPTVSVGSSVRGFNSMREIEAGRSLLRSKNIESLESLSKVERAQVEAYYKSLMAQDQTSYVKLFQRERDDLNTLTPLIFPPKTADAVGEATRLKAGALPTKKPATDVSTGPVAKATPEAANAASAPERLKAAALPNPNATEAAKASDATSTAKDVMSTRFGLPPANSADDVMGTRFEMPRGKEGGLASLEEGIPRGMPSGSDRGMIDESILKSKAGTEVKDTRPFGMTPAASRAIQDAVDDAGLSVRVRAANANSLEQMRQGHPPKHVKLKSKTINDLDVELGAKPGTQGMVGYFMPKKPGELVLPPKPEGANAAQLARWEEAVETAQKRHAALTKRYNQRLKEFGDNAKDINALKQKGLISVEDGVVVDRGLSNTRLDENGVLKPNLNGPAKGTGKGFTGDPDMWDIRHPDGRPIVNDPTHPEFDEASYIRKLQLQEALDNSLAKTQHGPHKDWRPLTQRDIGIDQKIRESHNPGGEALLEFNPGQKLPKTSYEIDGQGKLILPKISTGTKTKVVQAGAQTVVNNTAENPADAAANSVPDPGPMIAPGLSEPSEALVQNVPKKWLQDHGLTQKELSDLVDRSRRGDTLTTKEMQDKLEFLAFARELARKGG